MYNGDISKFVPEYVIDKVKEKYNALNNQLREREYEQN